MSDHQKLPDFIIIGAQKSGTTALWKCLRKHPEIFMPEEKEINYFKSDENNYAKGIDWYAGFFKDSKDEKSIGEASPRYLFYPDVAEKIHRFNKDIKLICILRNPVDRAYSHYWHNVRDGLEDLSFKEAVDREKERIKESDYNYRAYSYISRGFYYDQIRHFLDYFDITQIHFIIFEELIKHPAEIIEKTLEYLNVDTSFIPKMDHVNQASALKYPLIYRRIRSKSDYMLDIVREKTSYAIRDKISRLLRKIFTNKGKYPRIDPKLRKYLERIFNEKNRMLSQLLNKDLDIWNGE